MTKQVMVKILGHVVAVPEVVPLAVEAAVADQWAAVVVAPDPCLTRIIGEFFFSFQILTESFSTFTLEIHCT